MYISFFVDRSLYKAVGEYEYTAEDALMVHVAEHDQPTSLKHTEGIQDTQYCGCSGQHKGNQQF